MQLVGTIFQYFIKLKGVHFQIVLRPNFYNLNKHSAAEAGQPPSWNLVTDQQSSSPLPAKAQHSTINVELFLIGRS